MELTPEQVIGEGAGGGGVSLVEVGLVSHAPPGRLSLRSLARPRWPEEGPEEGGRCEQVSRPPSYCTYCTYFRTLELWSSEIRSVLHFLLLALALGAESRGKERRGEER